MHAELNNRPGEKRRSCSDVEGVLAGLSVFVCSSSFPFVICLRRSPAFSSVFVPFSLLVLAFLSSLLFCRSGAETGKGDGTAAFLFPCFFLFSSLLFSFPPSLFCFPFSFSLFTVTNRNSFCSLRFISTPSVLFSFFLLLPLFLLLLPASPRR
ncbi:hypothetical protein POPTR_006G019650v4 [Populus trichocarpa]|uniref:Uncharacterized protein n=1 Tax=Populus trichocarpa TaxID=3694 RepID=A0ACC0SRT6_POPTR|nr:hypothetical protein POPTR_006G019650v4 [Populus trichocarpa]